ncbi:peptidase M24 family protein [Halalkalibacillus sediminis]|uniref:Peptidase M24 family protein n=1 Tax=Halalkalibacillus sediminis TaxID=2018042 RepID=A0A2I0QY67_9BACI|nr:Xaa-Pro peptidase family protein [Halalkalibacillus sediminis]PKR79282.1 peptidase M24 family protein [Halalkalibacillus sediminis]
MEKRIKKVRESMKERDVDAVFLTSKANVFYYSNLYAEAHERLIACYIDQNGNQMLIVPALEKEDVKNAGWQGDTLTYFDHEDPWDIFAKYLHDQNANVKTMAVEKGQLNVERFERLVGLLPDAQFADGQEMLNQIRVQKDEQELKILKEAASFADYGVETAVKHIAPGKTELEIVAEVEYALKKKGIRHMSFSTLVLTGEKTASPHGNPSTTKIQSGDFVLMDLGVVHKGYCSDITRTVAVGEVSDEQKKIYETVLEAELAGLDACKIGEPLGSIDQAARNVITEAGYGEYFTHRIGHGLGIDVHEYPSMASNNQLPLRKGMTFTIEPGIYLPGVGGVRIEDDVYMSEEDGPVRLTEYPKELIIL